MSESHDMDAPVTRRELHEALETWAGAIISRLETTLERFALKQDLAAMEQRLMMELRRHTKASEIELAGRLVAVDQQYTDLPARVTRLEAKVFAPRKRGVATARRRKRS